MIEILGYIGALLIGVTLGLIGGGGSILTVPILVYILGISPVLATAYSLFVVGVSAAIGSFKYFQKGLLNYKTAIVFAIPSFIAVFLTRRFLLPAIPLQLTVFGDISFSKDLFIMVFFAMIMLFAAYSMIKNKPAESGQNENENETEPEFNYFMILSEGAVVGVLTGLVGAGGGFLIIPALVIFAKIPMKMAVGTSLLIIAAKSLIGFLGDIGQQNIDWNFLLLFTLVSSFGILLGSFLNNYISGRKLKTGFGYFVLVMAIYILFKELFI
ncbi:sulfite exporter TauE/SafE family protein [Hyphobacterium sp. CCMP332]|nr:sulfite exporter TauE/SafE family protein [Hyphobacterium sp. CCMP332]